MKSFTDFYYVHLLHQVLNDLTQLNLTNVIDFGSSGENHCPVVSELPSVTRAVVSNQ